MHISVRNFHGSPDKSAVYKTVTYLHYGEERGTLWRLLVELVAKFFLHPIGGVCHVVLALHHIGVELRSKLISSIY